MRDFNAWLSTFRASIADYGYYVDFPKIYKNVEKIKVELKKKGIIASKRRIRRIMKENGLVSTYSQTI